MILDTSSAIARVKKGLVVKENITTVTLIEYPPIASYKSFQGRIYFIGRRDQLRAFQLQRKLRTLGKPLGAADLLIAAVCLNRNEELATLDEDFLVIKEVEPSFRVMIEQL